MHLLYWLFDIHLCVLNNAGTLQVAVLKANNGFRKCQFMTWPEFEDWKRHFPESDPFSRSRGAAKDDGGSSSGSGSEDGGSFLQSLLGNNCAVM